MRSSNLFSGGGFCKAVISWAVSFVIGLRRLALGVKAQSSTRLPEKNTFGKGFALHVFGFLWGVGCGLRKKYARRYWVQVLVPLKIVAGGGRLPGRSPPAPGRRAWPGMAWYWPGLARHGLVLAWHRMASHGQAWLGTRMAWPGLVLQRTARHGLVLAWHGQAWYCSARPGTGLVLAWYWPGTAAHGLVLAWQ